MTQPATRHASDSMTDPCLGRSREPSKEIDEVAAEAMGSNAGTSLMPRLCMPRLVLATTSTVVQRDDEGELIEISHPVRLLTGPCHAGPRSDIGRSAHRTPSMNKRRPINGKR